MSKYLAYLQGDLVRWVQLENMIEEQMEAALLKVREGLIERLSVTAQKPSKAVEISKTFRRRCSSFCVYEVLPWRNYQRGQRTPPAELSNRTGGMALPEP